MKRMIFIVLFSLFLSANVSAEDINGYGKAKWGMSPEAVMSSEAGRAKMLNPPEKFKGALGMVSIGSIDIASQNFSVIYLFDSNNLVQVNVSSHEDKNELVNKDTFNRIESLLIQKYGAPTHQIKNESVVWKLKSTTISLSHINIKNVVSRIVISYKPTVLAEKSTSNL